MPGGRGRAERAHGPQPSRDARPGGHQGSGQPGRRPPAEGRPADSRRIYGPWVDDVLVGGTLFPSINPGAGTAELGVFLAKKARGQGIVTRTVAAMIDWAFDERGLRRLEWRCAPGNAASRAIPRRLGFTHEGTPRQVFRVRADFHDLEVWSLLREEWRA